VKALAVPMATTFLGSAKGRLLLCSALYVTLAAFAVAPLLWTAVPALVDYPVHLARMWILAQQGMNPELASNYLIHWRLVPNLAMDLIVPTLAQIMPIEGAGRVFIALTMLALFGGTLALHRALHGHVSIWPASSLLFIYNAALFWGFLNFLFGLGIFLLTFSGWIATGHWRIVPRLVLFAVAASLLLVLHLFPFGLYGMSVMSYELGRRLEGGRLTLASFTSLCVIGLQFVPALILLASCLPSGAPMFTSYGALSGKQYALLAPWTFGTEMLTLDVLLVIFCSGFVIFAIMTRSLRLIPEMRWPLVVMAVAAILIPNWLSGSWLADIRVPIALPFMIIASTRLQSSWRRSIGVFAMAAVALIGARIWSVSEIWREYDRSFAEFRAATRAISPGARLLLVQNQEIPASQSHLGNLPLENGQRSVEMFWHLPALAVIDRAIYIPLNMFTGWTPLQPNPRNKGLFRTQGVPLTRELLVKSAAREQPATFDSVPNLFGELPYFGGWPNNFDYVLYIDFGYRSDLHLEALQLVATGSFFQIYRVIKP
jgi:hypothetical protein